MAIDGGLRALFQKNLPEFFWTAIETGSTGRGIPDHHFIHAGISGWIEYKVTEAYAVDISPEQVAWAERCIRNGGRHFIAVRQLCAKGPRREAKDQLYIFHGSEARKLATGGLDVSLAVFWGSGGPKRWVWPAVKALLTEN